MPARSVLYLHAKPGQRAALVETFARIDVLGHALQQEGCLGVEVQVPPDEDGPLLVTALWRRREDYDGWLANPWRAESTAKLAPYISDEQPVGVVYDVVLAAGSPEAATALAEIKTPLGQRAEGGA
ncbi:MAG: antibiotic biosynthesis monooxygenase [Chloroflexia bacterium]|nr:antibiotic biosynthesis monooxygenase [Chloroflexia bacterium]